MFPLHRTLGEGFFLLLLNTQFLLSTSATGRTWNAHQFCLLPCLQLPLGRQLKNGDSHHSHPSPILDKLTLPFLKTFLEVKVASSVSD